MDSRNLAEAIVVFLAPHLPSLVMGAKRAGEKAAEKGGEILANATLKKAERLWSKITARGKKRQDIQDVAVESVSGVNPKNAQEQLTRLIEDALNSDPKLREHIRKGYQTEFEYIQSLGEVGPGAIVDGMTIDDIRPGSHVRLETKIRRVHKSRIKGARIKRIG